MLVRDGRAQTGRKSRLSRRAKMPESPAHDRMNYRHAFHAGNFADVFKHTLLLGLLDALGAKVAPYCYVDTHAGGGRYDLGSPEASKTGEHAQGIGRLLDAPGLPAALARYVALVRASGARADGTLLHYPGSPLIAAQAMREQDRAIVCELHPDQAAALRSTLRGDRRFAVHCRDGYEALKALLPPAQKRGLVLIDPPFEAQGGEFAHIERALAAAFTRWPAATFAIWYPIKQRIAIAPFHRWLHAQAPGGVLVAELMLHPENSPLRLNGCGLALANPPWHFDAAVREWLPPLAHLLAQGPGGGSTLEWLKKG
jgi:23S rRNA (adenine2030-N6)-methyltransferase